MVAKTVSFVMQPLLIPLYSLLLIFNLQTFSNYLIPDTAKWLILVMTGIATIAFPILLMMLFIKKGLITSIYMEKREDRIYPCLIVSVVYFVMYLLFHSIHIPSLITNFFLGVASLMLIVLFINFRWKISIHLIAAGGMTGTFTAIAIRYELNLIWLIVLLIFLSGLSGFARLKLNAHKPSEIYSGFLVGTAAMMLVYLLI